MPRKPYTIAKRKNKFLVIRPDGRPAQPPYRFESEAQAVVDMLEQYRKLWQTPKN